MPTKKTIIQAVAGLIILLFALEIQGSSYHPVRTGPENSASWQFTHLLSRIWKMKHQDKDSYFISVPTDSFLERFQHLNNKECKLIIAPLKSMTNLPITDMKVKIVLVLWQSYLVPIASGHRQQDIGLEMEQGWLLPENSLIIPHFLNRLDRIYEDAPADMDPVLRSFIQSMDWKSALSDFQEEHSKESERMESDSFQSLYPDNQVTAETRAAPLRIVKREELSGILSTELDEVLFYEMIGSYSHLTSRISSDNRVMALDAGFINHLMRHTWFLESHWISGLNIRTVGLTYALYVHEEEDPEFVTELLETLVQQPNTYFPKAYLLENLSSQETKQLSPLFLHESAIEFFDID